MLLAAVVSVSEVAIKTLQGHNPPAAVHGSVRVRTLPCGSNRVTEEYALVLVFNV